MNTIRKRTRFAHLLAKEVIRLDEDGDLCEFGESCCVSDATGDMNRRRKWLLETVLETLEKVDPIEGKR